MSTTAYSQVLIYTAESTGASMERTKLPNLRHGSKAIPDKTIYHDIRLLAQLMNIIIVHIYAQPVQPK